MSGSEIILIIITLLILGFHATIGYFLLKIKGHNNIIAYITLLLSFTPLFWILWGCTTSKQPTKKTRNWTYGSLVYGLLGVIYILLKRA